MRIALYGKGGIGKSTIASNVSACCGKAGKKVLQIGCDPKHDSTMLISQYSDVTLLDKLSACNDQMISRDEIIVTGKYGIDCIEIGGPKPGVGCAGRGIIRGINAIEQAGILQENYDLIIYDILGDVVCGGFFEPIKGKKVDTMYIVTSGEFNSLFAANNICAGFINCGLQNKGISLGGIIGNMRGIPHEEELIKTFCSQTSVDLVAMVPKSNSIEEATLKGSPIVELYPDSDISSIFNEIGNIFSSRFCGSTPTPVSLSELRNMYHDIRQIP